LITELSCTSSPVFNSESLWFSLIAVVAEDDALLRGPLPARLRLRLSEFLPTLGTVCWPSRLGAPADAAVGHAGVDPESIALQAAETEDERFQAADTSLDTSFAFVAAWEETASKLSLTI